MIVTKPEAIRLRKIIERAMTSVDEKTVSEAVTLLPHMKYDGALITAGTPIEWNGTAKKAAVDLWDREENNPDNAPVLWADIEYRDGIRIIPEVITVAKAFALYELGWWGDEVHRSKVDANVYTPAQYPPNWEKVR